jgi:hypothetical protein
MTTNVNLNKRIKTYKHILSDKKDGEILCPDEYNVLNHDVLLLEQIGSKSINGEAYKACTPYDELLNTCSDDPGTMLLSTKKIPLTQYQKVKFPLHTIKEELLKNDVFVELVCMKLCSFILLNEKKICPNLPLYYNYYLCNNCTYTNKEILNKNIDTVTKAEKIVVKNEGGEFSGKLLLSNIKSALKKQNKSILDPLDTDKLSTKVGKPIANLFTKAINDTISNSCVLLVNEFANEGDLKNWLKIKNWGDPQIKTHEEWYVMFFQVYAGLYSLQKYFDLTHHDLHWGNVLVHKIQPGGFLTYKIDNEYYKVPNIGYLFTLWDFGYAYIPNKLKASNDSKTYDFKDKNRYSIDYFRIAHAAWWNMDTKEMFPNGITPSEIVDFYYQTKNLYDLNVPLKYTFSNLFKSYSKTEIPTDLDYIIDDNNIPIIPDEYKWLLNDNKNYQEFDMDMSNVFNNEIVFDKLNISDDDTINMK